MERGRCRVLRIVVGCLLTFLFAGTAWAQIQPDQAQKYKAGAEAYQRRDWEGTIRELRVLPPDYRTWPARYYLARALYHTGKHAESLALTSEALGLLAAANPNPDARVLFDLETDCLAALPEPGAMAEAALRMRGFYEATGQDGSRNYFLLARALKNAGKLDEASSILAWAGPAAPVDSTNRVNLWNLQAELFRTRKDADGAVAFVRTMVDPDLLSDQQTGHLIPCLVEGGLWLLGSEGPPDPKALDYLQTAHRIAKPLEARMGTYLDPGMIAVYVDVARFALQNAPRPDAGRIHFLGLAWARVDAPLPDSGRRAKAELAPGTVGRFAQEFRVFGRIMSWLSQGRIVCELELVEVDSTLFKVASGEWRNKAVGAEGQPGVPWMLPDPLSAVPYPSRIIWDRRNKVDAFVHLYPGGGLPPIGLHGAPSMVYVPGRLQGPPRTNLHLHEDSARSHLALVHEYFHAVELAWNSEGPKDRLPALVAHVYKAGMESLRPAWFRGGNELRYYEAAFRTLPLDILLPLLQKSRTPETRPPEVFEEALSP